MSQATAATGPLLCLGLETPLPETEPSEIGGGWKMDFINFRLSFI